MNVDEALEKASRILAEEEVQPTLSYRYVSGTWPSNARYRQSGLRQSGWTPAMAAESGLAVERKQRPRRAGADLAV